MRRFSSILMVFGAAALALSAVWFFAIGPALVRYPSDLNSSASAPGTFTLRFNPLTSAPYASPVVLPLTASQQLRSSASGSNRIVAETTTERFGPYTVKFPVQYVISARSIGGVRTPQSWSYGPANVVNRSGTYTVNLPFGAGSGPYRYWEDQTSASFPVRQSGPDRSVDGMTLEVFTGTMPTSRIIPAYVSVLHSTGLPSSISVAQLSPELAAAGVNLGQIMAGASAALPPAMASALQNAVKQPLALDYYLAEHLTLGVESRTGAVVDVLAADQNVSARVSATAIAGLAKQLAPLAGVPAIATFGSSLTRLTAPLPVFSIHLAGTPASVQGAVAVTAGYRDQIVRVEQTVPLMLVLAGAAIMLAGGVIRVLARRAPKLPSSPRLGVTGPPAPRIV